MIAKSIAVVFGSACTGAGSAAGASKMPPKISESARIHPSVRVPGTRAQESGDFVFVFAGVRHCACRGK
jgi:hypothetical protein